MSIPHRALAPCCVLAALLLAGCAGGTLPVEAHNTAIGSSAAYNRDQLHPAIAATAAVAPGSGRSGPVGASFANGAAGASHAGGGAGGGSGGHG